MPWTDSVLQIIKKKFGNEPFLVDEAVKVLEKNTDYSKIAIRQALFQLVKEGFLARSTRGIYEVHHIRPISSGNANLSSNVTVSFTSPQLIDAENSLAEKGIDFMITGPSALTRFHHLLTRRQIHLIYVIKGSGEYASNILKEKGMRAFLNPNREQIDVVLQALEEGDIFVIREYSVLEGNLNGRATIERALVDTYFEVTRYRIPFSEIEVGRLIANAFREEKIDISRLLRFASRRGIRGEMESIVKELVPSLQLQDRVLKESTKAVIDGIRS
jgi:hypothetical protein